MTNGMLIHLLDFDDEVPGNGAHPGSAIFPVVMALGEMNGLPGQAVLAAFAAGCEVTSKVQIPGFLRPDPRTGSRGSRSAVGYGLAAAMGATVAAGKLLELNGPAILQALLLACANAPADLTAGDAGPGSGLTARDAGPWRA